jgi:DNA repair exonuclease SbcCD ATPase subunit
MIRQNIMALGTSILLLSVSLFSCEHKEESQQLQAQLDSLQLELLHSQQAARMLEEVGILMDSIDASRTYVAINMETGPNESYIQRMESIKGYITESQERIAELEKSLQTSQSVNQTYATTIKKLKKEITSKNEELTMLQQQIEGLEADNASLVTTVGAQEEEIVQKTAEIMAQSEELAKAEAHIQEMIIKQQISEADAYYARGEAVEEVARRTQLARKKKQASYKEAIALYEKAYALGRTDAKKKIETLIEKIR